MIFKELYKGIDSLYLSFRGTFKDGLIEQLEIKKTLARSDDEKEQALSTIAIDDHCFEVKDKGKGSYAYVLVDGWYHIQVASGRSKRIPEIYVQVSSDLLQCFGLYNSMNLLRGTVKELVVQIEEENISRADIFVDFITDMDFELIKKKAWVTRAEKVDSHWQGNTFTGWSIGLGGAISARLYDKTKELEKSNKDYLKSIWQKQGWQEGLRVWRLEFQLKREVLSQMSINTISDLINSTNDIWRYCTHDWLRLAINNGDANRTRWNTAPVWKKIQQVVFGEGTYTGIMRHVDKSRIPADRTLFLNGLGYLTAFAAKEGIEDIEEAIPLFMRKGKAFIKDYTKNSGSYSDDKDYLQTKINLKKKRYNKQSVVPCITEV